MGKQNDQVRFVVGCCYYLLLLLSFNSFSHSILIYLCLLLTVLQPASCRSCCGWLC